MAAGKINFNPTIVRFKRVIAGMVDIVEQCNFNPTIVRFKHEILVQRNDKGE